MSLKHLPLILLAMLVGIFPALASAKECANRTPTDVKKGMSGKRISGFFYGQYLKKEGTQSTLDYFFLGHGLPEGYISEDVEMWRPKKDTELAQKVRNTSANPIAVNYSYPYDLGVKEPYTVQDIFPYYEAFEHSQSYGFYYDDFVEACDVKRGSRQKQLTTSGYVVRVERKGFIKQTRSCNVYINTGKSREETRTRVIGYKKGYCPEQYTPHVSCTPRTPITEPYQVKVPVIDLVVAYSEEACSYAEDTGRSQVLILVDYSIRKRAYFTPNNTVIHRISIQEKLSQ